MKPKWPSIGPTFDWPGWGSASPPSLNLIQQPKPTRSPDFGHCRPEPAMDGGLIDLLLKGGPSSWMNPAWWRNARTTQASSLVIVLADFSIAARYWSCRALRPGSAWIAR